MTLTYFLLSLFTNVLVPVPGYQRDVIDGPKRRVDSLRTRHRAILDCVKSCSASQLLLCLREVAGGAFFASLVHNFL